MTDLISLCKKTKNSLSSLINLSEEEINKALITCANFLLKNEEYIISENRLDELNAKKDNKPDSFIDRLKITHEVLCGMADGIVAVSKLKSPIGEEIYSYENGKEEISIIQKREPFGVIGIIYEARPNVTADAFALTLKTKNAVILKGGKEAINSNKAIVSVIKTALKSCNISSDVISLIEDTSRETTLSFMKMNDYVDLLIPRGSASLINSALENSTIPIIQTGTGNCHAYIDEFADFDKAVKIIFNAKTQRYGVCNALESLVVHEKVLDKVLPLIKNKLKEKNVELRCDEKALKILKGETLATEEDFYTEFLGPVISVKTVSSLEEAILFINSHSTHHSESIITENEENARKFMKEIDSTSVYHNASTRFTDGFVFGFGAEIGISTQKLHARGPMGLKALTTTKFYITDKSGKGAVRK